MHIAYIKSSQYTKSLTSVALEQVLYNTMPQGVLDGDQTASVIGSTYTTYCVLSVSRSYDKQEPKHLKSLARRTLRTIVWPAPSIRAFRICNAFDNVEWRKDQLSQHSLGFDTSIRNRTSKKYVPSDTLSTAILHCEHPRTCLYLKLQEMRC